MRVLDPAIITALSQRVLVLRYFYWITVVSRSDGSPTSFGYWSDSGTITASVVDGRSGSTESRDFYGLGNGISPSDVPLTADVTIRNLTLTLPHLDSIVQSMVRTYDARNAPMQRYVGFFDPSTRELIAAPQADFVGYVDGAPIETPAENQEGSITLNCVSTTRELTRANAQVRSNDSQILRSATDNFYDYTAVVGGWIINWGQNSTQPVLAPTTPKFGANPGGAIA
jgi:hypothetical protein